MQLFRACLPIWAKVVHISDRYRYIRKLTGHWDGINGVAFSNNGRLLASASE